jgi:hypothetical protein
MSSSDARGCVESLPATSHAGFAAIGVSVDVTALGREMTSKT